METRIKLRLVMAAAVFFAILWMTSYIIPAFVVGALIAITACTEEVDFLKAYLPDWLHLDGTEWLTACIFAAGWIIIIFTGNVIAPVLLIVAAALDYLWWRF